ncbi:hypothetical protein THAOC_37145, partial [Thalassiosira oceanica]
SPALIKPLAGMAVNSGCSAVRGGQNLSSNQQPRSAPTPRPTGCMAAGRFTPTCLSLLCYEGVLPSSISKPLAGMAVNAGCSAVRGGQTLTRSAVKVTAN